MNKLEQIRQKMEAEQEQENQRAAEMESIRGEIDDLEQKIGKEIESGTVDKAEKLIAEQNMKKARLEALGRFNSRKLDPRRYLGDLAGICTEQAADYQPKIDKAAADLEKAHRAYLEKKAALVRILNEAGKARQDCIALSGITVFDDLANQFPAVVFDRFATDLSFREKETIMQMEPAFFDMLEDVWRLCGFKD